MQRHGIAGERCLTTYSDSMFNPAQLMPKSGDIAAAKPLFERYLASNPPAE